MRNCPRASSPWKRPVSQAEKEGGDNQGNSFHPPMIGSWTQLIQATLAPPPRESIPSDLRGKAMSVSTMGCELCRWKVNKMGHSLQVRGP